VELLPEGSPPHRRHPRLYPEYIKRTGEGVIVIGDSPAKKNGKSGLSATITRFAQAKTTTATQLGQLAAQTRQIQAGRERRTYLKDVLMNYHCQLAKCDNSSKICAHKNGRHFMFDREMSKLWNEAIMTGEATIQSFPVSLLHLLTVRETGDRCRRTR
jgi:hypothetical protein